jgi:hypothetical protein
MRPSEEDLAAAFFFGLRPAAFEALRAAELPLRGGQLAIGCSRGHACLISRDIHGLHVGMKRHLAPMRGGLQELFYFSA